MDSEDLKFFLSTAVINVCPCKYTYISHIHNVLHLQLMVEICEFYRPQCTDIDCCTDAHSWNFVFTDGDIFIAQHQNEVGKINGIIPPKYSILASFVCSVYALKPDSLSAQTVKEPHNGFWF